MQLDKKIISKLYRYSAYQERCVADVRKKLFQLEVAKRDYEHYINHLIEERFVDESRYVEAFVKGKFRQSRWGKNKIKFALGQKNIDRNVIQKGLGIIPEDEYKDVLLQLLQRKASSIKDTDKYKRKNKLMQFAIGKGFELHNIKEALDRASKIEET